MGHFGAIWGIMGHEWGMFGEMWGMEQTVARMYIVFILFTSKQDLRESERGRCRRSGYKRLSLLGLSIRRAPRQTTDLGKAAAWLIVEKSVFAVADRRKCPIDPPGCVGHFGANGAFPRRQKAKRCDGTDGGEERCRVWQAPLRR